MIEKDLGFLRIGSLNVRVKKTTEAFSNFLGVGTNNNNNHGQYSSNSIGNGANHRMIHARNSVPTSLEQYDKLHKNWGSADNIPPSLVDHYLFIYLYIHILVAFRSHEIDLIGFSCIFLVQFLTVFI